MTLLRLRPTQPCAKPPLTLSLLCTGQTQRMIHSFLQSSAHFAQLLFVDRMRKPADRQHVADCFEKVFGTPGPSAIPQRPSHVALTSKTLQLGWASLPRATLAGEPTPCPCFVEFEFVLSG